LLAVLVGLGSCELNPQPPLPSRDLGNPSLPGTGGSLALGSDPGGSQNTGGTSNDSSKGGASSIDLGGASAEIPTSDAGADAGGAGSGGAADAGGEAGAAIVPVVK
jgi:hypothetical protein